MHRQLAALLLVLLALPSLAAITGTVMTSDGAPVAGAKVSILPIETPEARRTRLLSDKPELAAIATATTDARGNYSLESPKEPVVDLKIVAAGHEPVLRRVERDEEAGATVVSKVETKPGTVKAGGKPVAGATVVIAYGNGAEHIVRTDEQGKYEAPDVKRARAITVIHPSYAMDNELFLTAPSPSVLNRTLAAGTTLTGRVVGADGSTPVAKAAVMVDSWPAAVTADDGTFTIAHAPAKWTSVTAQSGSLVAMRAQSKETSLTLKLAKPGTLNGRVMDAKTKLPVAGAFVRAGTRMGRMSMGADAWGALTDAKGNFSIHVPPGTYAVTTIHPAYEVTPLDISVAAGQSQVRDLSATPLARVSGVVVNEDRQPVAAAVLSSEVVSDTEVFPPPARMMMMRDANAVSGPDGRFSMRVAGDSDLRVRANRKGLPLAKSDSFRIAPGDRKTGVVVTIPSGIAVTGRVTDREGKPLSGVAVTANEAAGGPRGMVRNIIMLGGAQQEEDAVRTGSDGTFTLRVKEGTYDFAFRREGYSARFVRGQSITPSGAQPIETTLDPAVEVTGKVVRDGTGVEGVMINTFGENGPGASAVTGPDGSFTLTGLSTGDVRASIRKESEFVQEMRMMTAPGRDVVIELPSGVTVRGRVIDKATRKPVASFQAGVSQSRGGGAMVMIAPPQLKAFTNDDGSFVLENVPIGAVNLVAQAPGYAQTRMNVTIEEGKPLSDIELELDPGTKLVGKVTGPDGSALSGASVRVALIGSSGMINASSMKQTVTDSNGEYTLDALEPTDESIEFSHPKYVGTRKTITPKGREVRLDVQLSAGQRVSGVVVTEGGMPVPEAEVEASAGMGNFRSARSDANGVFTFESLSPARYRFSASKRGYAEARVDDFDIAGGGQVRLVMKSGATIYGSVRGLTPDELQQASVEARTSDGYASAPVDSTGNFKIEGAPVGTVRVAAAVVSQGFSMRKTSQPQTVNVEAGESRQVELEFRSDVVVRGRVTRNGKVLQSAQVSFSPRRGSSSQTSSSASTDSAGNYSVSGLESGEYNVNVIDMQRFSPYSTTYEVRGSATFDIDFTANSLRGRVVDAATGDPIDDVRVQVRATTQEGFRGDRSAVTDVNGSFSVDFISPGTYTLTADKPGFGNEVREVIVGESTPPPDVELKLGRNAGVTLKVVDARDGRAITASVDVFDMSGRQVQDTGFRFSDVESAADVKLSLSPGQYVATVLAPGYAPQSVNLTSPGTQTVAVSPGGRIVLRSTKSDRQRVRLVDSRGVPYPRTRFAMPARDLQANPSTLPLNNVAPGSYTVQVLTNADTVVVKSIPVVVTEGGTVEVDV